jgi:hypothetical protein
MGFRCQQLETGKTNHQSFGNGKHTTHKNNDLGDGFHGIVLPTLIT